MLLRTGFLWCHFFTLQRHGLDKMDNRVRKGISKLRQPSTGGMSMGLGLKARAKFLA